MDSKNEMPEESPIPVDVKNLEPLRVEIEEPDAPEPVKTRDGSMSLPATTTEQEDIVTKGQRMVNLIWEFTQAIIAVTITLAIVYTSIMGLASNQIANAFFLIIGFYFSRSNHQAIGGVGRKATDYQKYVGR